MKARRWTVAAVTAVALGVSSPAFAAPGDTPAETVADAAATAGEADEREPLTPEQVAEQVEQAKELHAQLEKDDSALAEASAELAALSARSNELMNDVTEAMAAQAEAEKKEKAELAELERLTAEVAAAQKDLTDMAYDSYVNGPGLLREVAAIVDIVRTGGDRADAAAKAGYLAQARAADQKHFDELAAAQREAATAAAAARKEREEATAAAEKAHQEAADAVAEQQQAVIALQEVAQQRRDELEGLGMSVGILGTIDLEALEAVQIGPLCSQDEGTYPNGRFPDAALCGLESASGHKLQPRAARAFDAMAAAYQEANGRPLCITDSYRSYAAQVDVRARKPTLAAVPGTSNHGLGLAVDLCGGIENFGTPQHRWMQQHAPLFGFFHPAWAQANGSKPEPWHWEFMG
ncbi:MAG: M15 family metallopeptidase [Mobilicoccus sp.]|nr:M15 family metallopeptidase [Mobilicoccus sp.]